MRVIVTARSAFANGYEQILQRLVAILGVISKNPSNPNFDQYIFESISALMRYVHVCIQRQVGSPYLTYRNRFVVQANPSTLPRFEQALFGPFTIIIQQDIDRMSNECSPERSMSDLSSRTSEYIPYVFQILAQMLDLHRGEIPAEYRSLLPVLLTPASWQQKGSIPGLVKLLKTFLAHDANSIIAAGQLTQVLGVVQQRLIPSKINDGWGFELLEAVIQYTPS